MHVLLVHNPDAGADRHPSGDELVRLVRSAGHTVRYRSSALAGWADTLREGSDLVAVAGGDGIVGKVSRRMIGDPRPVAILPLGTANNIANAVGVADRPLAALVDGWRNGHERPFDTGIAVGPWGTRTFLEGVGVGLFADTMFRLDARNNRDIAHLPTTEEKMAAVSEIMHVLLDTSPAHALNLTVDGRDLGGEYVLVETMNIRSIGPQLMLAPQADPHDGQFDIVLVAKDEIPQLSDHLCDRIDGKLSLPGFTVRRGRRLTIGCPPLRIHLDDDKWPEDHSPPSPIRIHVDIAPASLRVWLPA